MPPKAAMYWSCLPIGSRSRSISMWQACSASSLRMNEVAADARAERLAASAVVKLPDEPRPVPAGMSAMLVISSCVRLEADQLEQASRMIGCWTSSIAVDPLQLEYLTIRSVDERSGAR